MIGLLRRLWAKQRHAQAKTLWEGSLWAKGLGGAAAGLKAPSNLSASFALADPPSPPAAVTGLTGVFIPDQG